MDGDRAQATSSRLAFAPWPAASTPKRPATLLDLPRLLTDPKFRRQQIGRVQGDMALAGFWSWYEAQSPQAQAAAIAPPLNKLRQLLLRPALIRMLDQRKAKFRLRDIFREKKIVLVPLNEGLIGPGTASLLGSLVIADLWQATQERADEKGASKRPAVVYVDEAPRFLNLPVSLADALAVSRSLSVGWFLAAQFRSQFPPAAQDRGRHERPQQDPIRNRVRRRSRHRQARTRPESRRTSCRCRATTPTPTSSRTATPPAGRW